MYLHMVNTGVDSKKAQYKFNGLMSLDTRITVGVIVLTSARV